jgi:hypothetical protein
MFIEEVLYQICYFGADRKSNMAARANNVFWLVETLKIFLSETTQPMELYHYRNDDWVVLYQVCYFCADRISKMATTGQQ